MDSEVAWKNIADADQMVFIRRSADLDLHCFLKRFSGSAGQGSMFYNFIFNLSPDMRFATIRYVRPAKPQISLRIHAV